MVSMEEERRFKDATDVMESGSTVQKCADTVAGWCRDRQTAQCERIEC